ncbi:MAG: phosphotransferase [Litoreibacter sp.]|nr:phosphotransferase [Litoreibacter sp.]
MPEARHEQNIRFLAAAGWSAAQRMNIAGDASGRSYERLRRGDGTTAVLMDAPSEKGEDVRPFVHVANHLNAIGLSAPKILCANPALGFLLLEDLGDDLFARIIAQDPGREADLYKAAIDVLIAIQSAQPSAGLEPYGPAQMAQTALLAVDWYLRYASPDARKEDVREEFEALISGLLTPLTGTDPVVVLRDYHSENLLWLPERRGAAQVGLLDFQDAMLGHPAYDLASLLKDARRDVTPATQNDMVSYFLDQTGADRSRFLRDYAICSAQRNLRIIGVFTRLCVRDGKRHYPDMIPRVWDNLMGDLVHPDLGALKEFVVQTFPKPTPEILRRIKSADV